MSFSIRPLLPPRTCPQLLPGRPPPRKIKLDGNGRVLWRAAIIHVGSYLGQCSPFAVGPWLKARGRRQGLVWMIWEGDLGCKVKVAKSGDPSGVKEQACGGGAGERVSFMLAVL